MGSAVFSGGAGGARAPPEFGGSEKGRSLISAYQSLAITTNTPGFKKLSTALTYHTYLFVFHILGGMGGCEYKAERMEALADLIKSRSPYFDLFLLAELWMQADHQLLEDAAKSVGLHMTGFRQLASG